MLRVLVGENEVESGFEEAAETGGTVGWVVPRDTRPGDEAAFLFHHSMFLGTGTVLTSPKPGQHGRRAVALARIGELKRFPRDLPLSDVAAAIPGWKWTTYPRSFTTPAPDVAARLRPLLAAASSGAGVRKSLGLGKRTSTPDAVISTREITGGLEGEPISGDPRAAASQWNELFGPAKRTTARVLTRSIQAAHALSDTCWTVTLGNGFMRLNVGVPLALTLAEEECQLIVMDDAELLRGLKKAGLRVERQQRFKTAPGTVSVVFPTEALSEVHGRAWRSHVRAMEVAARRQPVSPHTGYSVSLLAFLREQGFDVPDSESPKALQARRRAPAASRKQAKALLPVVEPFDPDSVEDARRRVLASIIRRQGQGEFRNAVLRAYGFSCAVTGCDVPEVLEAAHIFPYGGIETNHVQNGILLRADLHTLFDLGLLTFDHEWRVRLDESLKGTSYWTFHGMPVQLPQAEADRPSSMAVSRRSALA
jgi:hypothetical protein